MNLNQSTHLKFLFAFLLLIVIHAGIQAQPYVIEDFQVTIQLNELGEMNVKESITVNFNEQRRGIFRKIPYKFKLNGKAYNTNISEINVPGYKNEVSNEGKDKVIKIGDANKILTGLHTYVINYKVQNAIIEYEDGQELYWNLIGPEWDTEIKQSSFKVIIPYPFEIQMQNLLLFTGKSGSKESNGTIAQTASNEISGKANQALFAGEGMTIAIKFPTDYMSGVTKFDTLKSTGIDKKKNKPWFLLIPLMFWGIIRQWWKSKRDKNRFDSNVIPQHYPPKGLTSAHVGAYIDHKVQTRDVISLIPYWATEGFLKVRGLEGGDMELIKVGNLPYDYPEYEHQFFNKIFEDRDSIKFSDAQYKFGTTYYQVKKQIVKELESAGYYDDSYVYMFKTFRWPLICTGMIVAGILTLVFWGSIIIGVGLILAGVASFAFSFFTAPLSEFGQKIHDHIKGLEMFLKQSDNEDEIQKIVNEDPDYFGRMLPFAVALGLDKQWLKKFEPIYETAPFWYDTYYYGQRPTFSHFSESFDVKEITRAFTTSPQVETSSSGGFSDGGFSGGGFGGGGGGSW